MTKRYVVDLLERTIATYVETFAGLLTVSALDVRYVVDMAITEKLGVAAVPAAYAAAKALLARFRGNRQSASMAVIV